MVSKSASPHLNPSPRPTGAKGLTRSAGEVSPAPDEALKPQARPQPRQRVKMPKPEGPLKKKQAASSASAQRRAAHKESLEQRILDAARTLFASEGQEAVTLREVAAAVGYSHATIYSFFADKRDLLARLSLEGRQGLDDALAGQREAGDAQASLGRAVAAYLRWAVAHPHHYRLLFVDPPSVAEPPPAYAQLRALLAALPVAGKPDLELRVQTLWAALHGAALLEIGLRPQAAAALPWCGLEARIAALAALLAGV